MIEFDQVQKLKQKVAEELIRTKDNPQDHVVAQTLMAIVLLQEQVLRLDARIKDLENAALFKSTPGLVN